MTSNTQNKPIYRKFYSFTENIFFSKPFLFYLFLLLVMLKMESTDNLLAARMCLKTSLEKSRALAIAIEKTGPRLKQISQRFPSFEVAGGRKCTLIAVREHIDRAVGPAAAVLKVFNAVHGLEKSLLFDPCSDLSGYLSVVKRLEEALKFLSNNSSLAIQWLDDTVEFLEENAVADERYMLKLKRSLKILNELKASGESDSLDGGLLNAAFDKLEEEFRRLLIESSAPLPMAVSSSSGREQPCIAPSPLPVSTILNLQAIVDRLRANNRLEKCVSIYVDVRSSNARASLEALDLDYLKVSITEFDNLMSIESYIDQWGKHLEFAIKHLFEPEYKLCNDVFEKIDLDVKMGCFANIVAQSGFSSFLQFGNSVTKSKKDPIKLLKLLEIFSALNKLRLDFNRLFGGKACIEIQTLTRNLIKKVVEGVCEIFWELAIQVELQRRTSPPPDGSVQRLVSFVIEYCDELLGDNYRPILTQVLVIQQSWKHEEYNDGLLTNEVLNIIKAIELNLESWSKAYGDTILSYIFRMSNHCHFCRNVKGTKLGELMGNSWLRIHEQYVEYYASVYLRESWDRLRTLLNQEDTNMFSAGSATARQLIKKRLKAFNGAFDDMYKKHSNWVITDKGLREKMCELVAQTVVPAYRSYLQNYGPLIESDASASMFLKYSEESLESMFSSLFKPKLGKYGSTKNSHLIDRIKNVVTNQLRSTLSAA